LGLIPAGAAATSGPQPLWGVTSASDAIAHLLAIGATVLEPVADVGEGVKVGAVMDPFGNRLGVIENASFDASAMR
jgi:predicted enzyme related to lactoylglutathione lyase